MQQRPLGSTGLSVSVLGYGAFKIGRNRGHHFPGDYALPTDDQVELLLNSALDAGINLIDTAPAYGLSEQRIARAIGRRREEYLLATKVGETFTSDGSLHDFTRQAVRKSIERSLSHLRAERLDLVCVHSDGNDLAIQRGTDVIETLQELQACGLVRCIGFSGKTVDGTRAAIDWADVLMVTYNRNDTSCARVIEEASAAGRGVIIKKGLASGRLPAESAIPFILSQNGVSCLLIDTLRLQHLVADMRLAEELGPDRGAGEAAS